jgi:BirA family biotin operon repressor/biotin-[acetyl-CoA-carboxylase] ligase
VSKKLSVNKLQEGLRTKSFGRSLFFSHSVSSTNDWAKELASLGAAEGTVAVAETQTHGRGRLNREWFSPSGGLWFSVILKPSLRAAEASKLVFVAGLAVAEVLHEQYGLKAETKWPNDVLINGRKICGILAEMSTTGEKVSFVVLGLGVSANFSVRAALPESLWKTATSLADEIRRKVSLDCLFKALVEKLESHYQMLLREGFDSVLGKWKMYAGFLEQQVEVVDQDKRVRGVAIDVDSDGMLVLKLEDGSLKRFAIGDVSVLW